MQDEEAKILRITVELTDGTRREITNGFCCDINSEEESANWFITEQTNLQDVALYSHSLVGSLLTDAEWDDAVFATHDNNTYLNKEMPPMT